MPGRRRSYGAGWRATTCRASDWRAWQWIEGWKGRELADNFCSRRADAVLASAEVDGVVLVIDAKNEKVAAWYASYGAVPLLDAPLCLLLPLATIEAALKKAR